MSAAVQAQLEHSGGAAEVAELEAQVTELMAESEALAEEALAKDEEIETLESRLAAANAALTAAQQAGHPFFPVQPYGICPSQTWLTSTRSLKQTNKMSCRGRYTHGCEWRDWQGLFAVAASISRTPVQCSPLFSAPYLVL